MCRELPLVAIPRRLRLALDENDRAAGWPFGQRVMPDLQPVHCGQTLAGGRVLWIGRPFLRCSNGTEQNCREHHHRNTRDGGIRLRSASAGRAECVVKLGDFLESPRRLLSPSVQPRAQRFWPWGLMVPLLVISALSAGRHRTLSMSRVWSDPKRARHDHGATDPIHRLHAVGIDDLQVLEPKPFVVVESALRRAA